MKTRIARMFCAAASGIALLYLYLSFISSFFSNPDLYPQTTLEISLIVAQAAKVAIILSIRRLRYAKSATIWVILALEPLIIPFLTGAFYVTGDKGYLFLFRDMFAVWPVALLLVATPYLIFRLSARMLTSAKLTRILPSAVLEFSFLTFVANLFMTGASGLANMESVLPLFASGLRSAILGGRGVLLPNNLLTAPSIVLYLALIVYVTLPENDKSNLDIPTALLIPLLSTVALLVWVLFAVQFIPSAIVTLTLPTCVVAGLIWWIARAK